jgi:very-short-patch-repair endonuclease
VVLIEAGLPAPVPNRLITDDSGGFLARGDLVYERLRIVIEYDGEHHAHPRQRSRDATRRTLLREHGWYVVEITAADLRNPQLAIAKVRAALDVRAAER